MTTAAVTPRSRIDRWTVLLVVGIADALLGAAGVLAASGGALLVASWVLLVVGVDLVLFALWRVRRAASSGARP